MSALADRAVGSSKRGPCTHIIGPEMANMTVNEEEQ